MEFIFYKYQGTGNDFVMVDNRLQQFPKENVAIIKSLCDRRFGIGADGLILLENDEKVDFKMIYYNSDGNQSSMCGNGGRCLVAFAKELNVIKNNATFTAIDGLHFATIDNDHMVSLQMIDVKNVTVNTDYIYLNTGSPHHILIVENVDDIDVKTEGAKIRYSDLYGKEGSNVNFIQAIAENEFSIRTYERGVEDETLSCGTGATAVAIAMHAIKKTQKNTININVAGGKLEINFQEKDGLYSDIFLKGPAIFVFKTTLNI